MLTVISCPPGKCLLPDPIVKQEPKYEPQRVLCCVSWRDITSCVEKNRHIDPFDPSMWIAAVEQIDQNSHHGANEEKVYQTVVYLSRLEHPLGSDCTPDQ